MPSKQRECKSGQVQFCQMWLHGLAFWRPACSLMLSAGRTGSSIRLLMARLMKKKNMLNPAQQAQGIVLQLQCDYLLLALQQPVGGIAAI